MKYKWKVDPKPTGRYSSFERRGFPHAHYNDEHESSAASIGSEEDYEYDPKIKVYKSLILRIADHSVIPWKWRKIVKRYTTIQDAKDGFERILKQHPEMMPKKTTNGLPSNLSL